MRYLSTLAEDGDGKRVAGGHSHGHSHGASSSGKSSAVEKDSNDGELRKRGGAVDAGAGDVAVDVQEVKKEEGGGGQTTKAGAYLNLCEFFARRKYQARREREETRRTSN